MLPSLFPLANPNKHFLVVVWFGANDAAVPSENPHVPLDEYTENIRAILEHVQQVCLCALPFLVLGGKWG